LSSLSTRAKEFIANHRRQAKRFGSDSIGALMANHAADLVEELMARVTLLEKNLKSRKAKP